MAIGKLYFTPTSCGAASFLAATYAGLDFEDELVNLSVHQTASGKDYYNINPKGNVPTLVTTKGTLTEGPSVLQYIADHAPNTGLAPPPGSFERLQLVDTFNYLSTEIHKSLGPLFESSWNDASKQKFRGLASAKLQFIEENMISTDPFLNPKHPSIAAFYLYVCLTWLPAVGLTFDAFPKLQTFFKEFTANPKIKAAKEKMDAASKPFALKNFSDH